MDHEVSKEALNQAVKCERDHICQKPGGKPCCEIVDAVNDAVFFTKYRHPFGCDYQHAFGSAHMCSCPARIELHRKHGA